MAADELDHVTCWHNGEKTYSPFSDGEMARRRDAMQARMDEAASMPACSPLSQYLLFLRLPNASSRRYGAVLTRNGVTTGIGCDRHGQPAAVGRRQRHLYRLAPRQLFHRAEGPAPGIKRLGVEFDEHLDLKAAGRAFADCVGLRRRLQFVCRGAC